MMAVLLTSLLAAGQMHHLGVQGDPEWDEYRNVPVNGPKFEFTFNIPKLTNDWTIVLRQRDVKVNWGVQVNGKMFTNLVTSEDDLVNAWQVPVARLLEGSNTVTIVPPKERDDIEVGDFKALPTTNIFEAAVDVNVGMPCRLTVMDANGSLAPMFVEGTNNAVRTGVAYLGNGSARVRLAPGIYTFFAGRGFEYSVVTQRMSLAKNDARKLILSLKAQVMTPGMISSDTHVHTFTYSRHGDATEDERAITLAGEGIELPISTDHNIIIDPETAAKRTGMNRFYTPVRGIEVTTGHAHFNIFPVDPEARVPNFNLTNWPALMENLRATKGVEVIILNHPRNVHNRFQPFASTNFNARTGENLRGFEFSFDAVEVLNSSALQTDWMLGFTDWMALLNYGYRITAVGSSDGHDVSRYIIGQGRSYVLCDDADVSKIDVKKACQSFLAGRVLVSMGLLADMKVQDQYSVGDLATGFKDFVKVTVSVQGPGWTALDKIQLFANGELVREENIAPVYAPGEKRRITWNLPKPPKDFHLVAIASGPPVKEPYWRIPKPYQSSSTTWKPRVVGATNPIWVDADNDGKFTPLRLQK